MKAEQHSVRIPLIVGSSFLIVLVLLELGAILRINNGSFIYTLDDPYIHLALAENLKHGHYGVNANEFSAPSSSILWPFIITPFSSFEYFPLVINTIFAALTVFVFVKIINLSFDLNDKWKTNIIVSTLSILLILSANVVGLIFTGMEHSLQVLVVALIAWGLILSVKEDGLRPWLLVAIVVAPLVRYENMSVSFAAICYLLFCKYYGKAISISFLIALFVGGFSVFLLQLGLDPLPSSVNVKSSIVESGGTLASFAGNLEKSLSHPIGTLLAFGVIGLGGYVLLAQRSRKKRKLAAATIIAVSLHLIAGRYGWYNRYELYIWMYFLLVSIYLIGDPISRYLETRSGKREFAKLIVLGCAVLVLANSRYIFHLFTVPLASNNIYEQQYAMHRFTVDYYKKPVAVNDLGYVSYKNSSYVLDLWGLASAEALNYRRRSQDTEWMSRLAKANNVELAMVYDNWFDRVPTDWIKIGDLKLGRKKVTVAGSKVAFYATNQGAYTNIVEQVNRFKDTLPNDVQFVFEENRG